MMEEEYLTAINRLINKIIITKVGRSCDFRHSALSTRAM